MFENSTEEVKIIEVYRLRTKIKEAEANGRETYKYTPLVRVTFEGLVLPDYVVFDKFRVPVAPYEPRVMKCALCLRTGHTHKHCSNVSRCKKCGEIHDAGEETECSAELFNCPNCKSMVRDAEHKCPRIDEIKKRRVSEMLRMREEKRNSFVGPSRIGGFRRKGVSYAGVARGVTNSPEEFPHLPTQNRFDPIDDDFEMIDNVTGTQGQEFSEKDTPVNHSRTGAIRKRKISYGHLEDDDAWFTWAEEVDKESRKKAPRRIEDPSRPQRTTRVPRPKTDGHGFDWKGLVMQLLSQFDIEPGTLMLIKDIVLPCLENLVKAILPKLFASASSHDEQ
ncbi:hypothetical protein DMENIID0001_013100 [Sergentomyia squamirostris]